MQIRHTEAQQNVRSLLRALEDKGYETRLDDSYPNELSGEVALDGDKVLTFCAEGYGELSCSIMQMSPADKSTHGSYVEGLSTYFNLGDDADAVANALIGEVHEKGYELQAARPTLDRDTAPELSNDSLGSDSLGI